MKRIKSTFISVAIALATATLVTSVVLAMSYISEANLYYVTGSTSAPVTYSSTGCVGGSCRYLNQNSSNPGVFRWTEASSGINNWYAYCPTIGQAAAKYGVTGESWTTVMNQANTSNQGNYVFLGYSDYSGTKALFTSNTCISGWGCYGLPVYWDSMGYSAH